ncbi:diaminopimelate decarboxylase [Patescibacteria group bacterium]|nr:diaminopimelate decarboxylase [Patescibacteria group bacterium]
MQIKNLPTPCYVYDRAVIEKRCRDLKTYFPGVKIFYAVKANSNPELLKIIRKEGLGIECVSPGEIRAGQAAGMTKEKISFTCSNLSESDLVFAARNAGYVHIDSLVQLETWGKKKLGRDVSLRINEGIGTGHHRHVVTGGPDSKFGISLKDLPAARKIVKKYGLRVVSLEQHIGSNVLDKDADIFLKSVRKLLRSAEEFPEVRHVDFGGGFGIPYRPTDRALNLKTLGKEFTSLTNAFAEKRGGKVTFALEPGRYVVAESGTLLTTVVDMKSTSKHQFVGVNSGFNHLIRPAMYGSYHPIENLSRKGTKKTVTIAGNVCESGDIFATHRSIVAPKIGDVLAIGNAGAYGMSMASVYNLRELPREFILEKGKAREITFSPEARVRTKK